MCWWLGSSFFFFSFIYLFYFTILYWFCHTLTWICNGCTCVPHPEPLSHLPPLPILLGHPSAPAPSTLYHASNLDWQFISHMIIYMFQCHSPISFHPHPLPQSPKDCSIPLCLFCCLTYRVCQSQCYLQTSVQDRGIKVNVISPSVFSAFCRCWCQRPALASNPKLCAGVIIANQVHFPKISIVPNWQNLQGRYLARGGTEEIEDTEPSHKFFFARDAVDSSSRCEIEPESISRCEKRTRCCP